MAFDIYDSVSTSPTNTFATLNVLGEGLSGTLSDGNLKYVMGNAHNSLRGNFYISSGKWYWEVYVVSATNSLLIGLSSIDEIIGTTFNPAKSISFYSYDGKIYYNSTSANYDIAYGSTDIIGVFLNLDDNQLSFYKNGSVLNSGTTIDLSNATYNLGTLTFTPRFDDGSGTAGGATFYVNFGVDSSFGGNKTSGSANATDGNGLGDFYYDPPTVSGTKALALCTSNIQSNLAIDPASDDVPEDYFKAVKYTVGTGTTVPVDVGFNADLHWIKCTTAGEQHYLVDTVRSTTTTFDDFLNSNNTEDEDGANDNVTNATLTKVTNGFEVSTTNAAAGELYFSNRTYISWNWKAGGAPDLTSSPTKPFAKDNVQYTDTTANKVTVFGSASNYTITPTSASIGVKQGTSVILYTGNNTTGATIPHGLTQKPDLIIHKNLSGSYAWVTYHRYAATGGANNNGSWYLSLNGTAGASSGSTLWPSEPNSNVVTVANNNEHNGASSNNYIMYCWHSVAGYSKFSSYVGNGSATSGPFIYTGFKPALVWIKCTSDATTTHTSWAIFDNAREPNNVMNKPLYANQSAAEGERGDGTTDATDIEIDFLSNGFRILTSKEELNDYGETYIFCCWAEMPQKFSVAR